MLRMKSVWPVLVMLLLLPAEVLAGSVQYTVKADDWLSKISLQLCRSAEKSVFMQIAKSNDIQNPNHIMPGQVLNIDCLASNDAEATRTKAQPAVSSTLATTPVTPWVSPKVATVIEEGSENFSVELAPKPQAQTKKKNFLKRTFELLAKGVRKPSEPILKAVIQTFGPKRAPMMLAIFNPESGFRLDATGYNCYFVKGRVLTREEAKNYKYPTRRSRACPNDVVYRNPKSAYAWSVDCGLGQINVKGTECTDDLKTLEGNLRAAKKKVDEGGLIPWSVYNNRDHVDGLPHYKKLVAEYVMANGIQQETALTLEPTVRATSSRYVQPRPAIVILE